ncbi:MAG: O-antigen ligase family protein [Fimbriimonadia bacterium]|jgi:O-antigen ligase/tetratricopeptide (TPR) repeat protein
MRPRIEWWLAAVALFLAPFVASYFAYGLWPAEGVDVLTGLPSGSAPELGHLLVGAPILVAFVVAAWRMPVFRLPTMPLLITFLIFWVLLVLSRIGTVFPATVSAELVRWSVCLCTMLVVTGVTGRGRYALALGAVLALAGALEALWAVRQYLNTFRDVPNWRVFGTFFNPDFLAGYLVMVAPLAMAFFARAERLRAVLTGLLAFLCLAAIVLTGSRGGLLSLGLATLAFLLCAWWNREADRRLLLRSGGILAGIALLFLVLQSQGGPARVIAAEGQGEGHSAAFRLHLWQDSVRMVAARPLQGFGLGSFPWARGPYGSVGFTRLAHNSYLQVASEAGVPALLALSVVGGMWFLRVGRREATPVTDKDLFLGVSRPLLRSAVLAAVVGAGAHNVIDSDLYLFSLNLTLWSLLGLGLSLAVDGTTPVLLPKRSFALGATVIVAVLGIALVTRAIASLIAVQAQAALESGDYAEARRGFEAALAWAPNDRRYLVAAGRLALAAREEWTAARYFRRAMRSEPSAEAFTAMALAYLAMGEQSGAADMFLLAAHADPYSLEALRGLMRTRKALGDGDWVAAAERIVSLRSSTHATVRAVPEIVETAYAEADAALGEAAEQEGNAGKALGHYRRAFEDLVRFLRVTYPMSLERGRFAPVREERAEEVLDLYFETLANLVRLTPSEKERAGLRRTALDVVESLRDVFERTKRVEDWDRFRERTEAVLGS